MFGKVSQFSILAASVTIVAAGGGVYLRMDRAPAAQAALETSANVSPTARVQPAPSDGPQVLAELETPVSPSDTAEVLLETPSQASRPVFYAATLSKPQPSQPQPEKSGTGALRGSLEIVRTSAHTDGDTATTSPVLAQAEPAPKAPQSARVSRLSQASDVVQVENKTNNPCQITLQAASEPAAQVRLFMRAACHGGSKVDITHAGLTHTDQLRDDGTLLTVVPAFEEIAKFSVVLADGTHRYVQAYVPDISAVGRSGISWHGPAELDLTARMPQGTFWAANPGSLLEARMFGGGYLTQLGASEGHRALVFSVINPDVPFVPLELFAQRCPEGLELSASRSMTGTNAQISQHRITAGFCARDGATLQLKNAVKHLRMVRN